MLTAALSFRARRWLRCLHHCFVRQTTTRRSDPLLHQQERQQDVLPMVIGQRGLGDYSEGRGLLHKLAGAGECPVCSSPTLALLRELESNYSFSRQPAMRTFQTYTSQKTTRKIWPTSHPARQGWALMETPASHPAAGALHRRSPSPRFCPGACCFSTCINFRLIQS